MSGDMSDWHSWAQTKKIDYRHFLWAMVAVTPPPPPKKKKRKKKKKKKKEEEVYTYQTYRGSDIWQS